MSCEQCKQPAAVHCEWGLYERAEPMNDAELCTGHSDALWLAVKPAVNCGMMHWLNRKIEVVAK